MKNKKYIIIAVLIIVIIAVASIIIINQPKKVEKLADIKILDSYQNEITDYNQNSSAFTIEKEKDEDKIYVNGKEYNSGERIYKVGTYKVVVKSETKNEKSIVKINEVEKKEENTYRIYVISETLQTLLANLDISSNTNQKGFLWTARTTTVNLDKVKQNIPNLQLSNNNGKLEATKFKDIVVPELKEYIKNVLKEDKNACFELYMEEDKFYLELELFGKIGLDDSRYNVIMYTNGTLGYVRQYEMTGANKYERYLKEKEDYFNIVEQIKNNTKEINDYPGSYLVDKESPVFGPEFNLDYMYISTLRNNIKLMLQYPEMIKFEDEKVSKDMEKANIEKIVVQEKFDKLNENAKNVFFDNIELNKEELDKNYFTDANAKYLVITGTVPIYENIGEEKFKEIIDKVKNDYGEEYTMLYKPHPRAIPTKEQEDYFNSKGIKVLPGSLPMEAISFVYPNLQLGGFGSSLYLSVDEGKTLFFFANGKEDLVEPLNKLYDSLFSQAKFYN